MAAFSNSPGYMPLKRGEQGAALLGDGGAERREAPREFLTRVLNNTWNPNPEGCTMLSVAKAMGKEALCAARPLHRGCARRLRHAQLCRGSGTAHQSGGGSAPVCAR